MTKSLQIASGRYAEGKEGIGRPRIRWDDIGTEYCRETGKFLHMKKEDRLEGNKSRKRNYV